MIPSTRKIKAPNGYYHCGFCNTDKLQRYFGSYLRFGHRCCRPCQNAFFIKRESASPAEFAFDIVACYIAPSTPHEPLPGGPWYYYRLTFKSSMGDLTGYHPASSEEDCLAWIQDVYNAFNRTTLHKLGRIVRNEVAQPHPRACGWGVATYSSRNVWD